MESIDDVFSNTQLTQNTRKAYISGYNKLINSGLFKRNISSISNENIIKNLHKITSNPNSFAMLLNVCILIKRHYGKNDESLVKYRNKQNREAIQQHHANINVDLQKRLPTYKELQTYTDNLYKNKQYLGYVINYLLITFGCRNRDIDAVITFDKENVKGEENYLHIRKTDIIFIRNSYKTVKKYGLKKNIIRSRKFYKAIDALKKQEGDSLLMNTKGERVSEDGVGGIIQNLTFEGIGEGAYFKVLVQHHNGKYNKLIELSKNRGTDIATILTRYDVSLK